MKKERIFRVNVAVDVSFDYMGHMVPTTIHDTDGELHWVDHVFSMQPASSGQSMGTRFDVKVDGKPCALYFEQRMDPCRSEIGHWYLELPETWNHDGPSLSAGA